MYIYAEIQPQNLHACKVIWIQRDIQTPTLVEGSVYIQTYKQVERRWVEKREASL